MAKYIITVTDTCLPEGHPFRTSERTMRTRPAAYGKAYDAWYAHLGATAGLDTAWGWRGVNALGDWLVCGASYEHGDKCQIEDPHGGYVLSVVRTA